MSSDEVDKFCAAPWNSLYVSTEGDVAPCCIYLGKVGNIHKDGLVDILRGNEIEQLKKDLLNNEKLPACKLCNTGMEHPMREKYNEQYFNDYDNKPTVEAETSFSFLDLRFGNTCNLMCRSCGPRFSHKLAKEENELKRENKNIHFSWPIEKIYSDKVLSSLDDSIIEICLAGGEPILSQEYLKLLERLIENNQTHFKILFYTNLNFSIESSLTKSFFKAFQEFENLVFLCSLDGMEEQAEFLRHGTIWKRVEKNFIYIKNQLPKATLTISSVVQLSNIFHLPKFIEQWSEREMISPEDWTLYILEGPESFRFDNLPGPILQKSLALWETLAEKIKPDTKLTESIRAVIEKLKSCSENKANITQLKRFLNHQSLLDKKRNESWERVFPELRSIIMFGYGD